jgi:hypothetical protein
MPSPRVNSTRSRTSPRGGRTGKLTSEQGSSRGAVCSSSTGTRSPSTATSSAPASSKSAGRSSKSRPARPDRAAVTPPRRGGARRDDPPSSGATMATSASPLRQQLRRRVPGDGQRLVENDGAGDGQAGRRVHQQAVGCELQRGHGRQDQRHEHHHADGERPADPVGEPFVAERGEARDDGHRGQRQHEVVGPVDHDATRARRARPRRRGRARPTTSMACQVEPGPAWASTGARVIASCPRSVGRAGRGPRGAGWRVG